MILGNWGIVLSKRAGFNRDLEAREIAMRIVAIIAGAFAAAALSWQVQAQSWPQRPVKIIVPYAAGGPSDSMARLTAQRLAEAFGQPFIVENQPTGGGVVAGELVIRAPADGHTLYWVTPGQVTILPAISKLSYDPVKNFQPITAVAENRFGLVVNSNSLPVSTIGGFVDHVRMQPGRISYAHAGAGGITHLAMALFARRLGLQMNGVAYKGIAPAFADVLGGHVPTMFASLGDAVQQQKGGKIKLLAVSTRSRDGAVPDVPAVSEAGLSGFHIVSWNGLVARSGTPKSIVERIASEVARAAKTPAFATRLTGMGFEPIGNSPDEFAAVIAAEIPMWMEAVKGSAVGLQ